MARRSVATVLLTVAFVAAGVAYAGWSAHRTVLDPSTSGDLARVLLRSDAVHDSLHDQLVSDVRGRVASDARSGPDIAAAIDVALRDERFVDAFSGAVEGVYRQVLAARAEPDGRVTLDLSAVTASVRDALAASVGPEAAAQFAQAEPVRVTLGDGATPHVGNVGHRAMPVAWIALLAALASGAAGVALHTDRRKAWVRVGRRVLLLGVAPVVMFVVLPFVLRATGNDLATMLAGITRVYGERVLPSALVLIVAGISTWMLAAWWHPGRSDRWDDDDTSTDDVDAPLAPVYELRPAHPHAS